MLRLGIMGGTFDPIHWAHLRMAEEARLRCDLEKVLFIPAGQPPHKPDYPISDAEDRYAMTLLATSANPAFEVSRMEIERGGPSYTLDTLTDLRKMLGPETSMHFIIGADEVFDLPRWHEAEKLPALARFLVAPRPGFDLTELNERLPAVFRAAIEFLPMPPIDISATDLRDRIASGRSIKYLVPECVESYIRKHKLYGGSCT